jgi:hypothetical protein
MANSESDFLSWIDALAKQSREHDDSLRRSIKGISNGLVESCKGIQIHASGKKCTLSEYAPDEYYYGYFFFSSYGIQIAHRSTDDDLSYDPATDPYGPTYDVQSLDACSTDWLTNLVSAGSLQTLLQQVGERLQERIAEVAGSVTQIDDLAKNPSSAVASAFEQAASQLGYQHAITEWRNAQADVYSNPSAAITRASSLIETVCKHILSDAKAALPSNQAIQSLVSAAMRAVGLDPAVQVEPELRGICGGLSSVAQNIGSLRTKAGDAHGRGPAFVPLGADHARLAVDAAGTIASFLIRHWSTKKGCGT